MSRRALRLMGLLAGAVLAACAGPLLDLRPAGSIAPASRADSAASRSPDEIPTSWLGGVALVEASIDGRGPCRLVLDSGCSVLVLTPGVVESLDLELADFPSGVESISVETAGGDVSIQQAARVAELRAGPFQMFETAALIVDLSPLEAASGMRIDGILPVAAFREGVLTLDVANERVTLVAGELPPADGDEVLDLLESDDRPVVEIDVAGVTCSALVDSGYTGYLSLRGDAAEVLAFRSPMVLVGRSMTMAGEVDRRMGRVDGALRLGRHTIADPVVAVTTERYALIGAELLREFRTSFDMRNRRMRVARTSTEPLNCPPVRSPGYGRYIADGASVVAYVLDGSPAALAGLEVGDRIQSIDGIPVGELEIASSSDDFDPDYVSVLRVVGPRGTREVRVGVATLVE